MLFDFASDLCEIFNQTSMPAIVLIVHQPHEDSSDRNDFRCVSLSNTCHVSGHRRVSPSSKQRGEPCSVAAYNYLLLVMIMLTVMMKLVMMTLMVQLVTKMTKTTWIQVSASSRLTVGPIPVSRRNLFILDKLKNNPGKKI